MRNNDKHQYWHKHIMEWSKSGKSKKAYCSDNGLSYWNFICWNGKLADASACDHGLIKIPALTSCNKNNSDGSIELITGCHHLRISIPEGYDSTTLKRLLSDLGVLS
jgi:hypothetical protein